MATLVKAEAAQSQDPGAPSASPAGIRAPASPGLLTGSSVGNSASTQDAHVVAATTTAPGDILTLTVHIVKAAVTCPQSQQAVK